MATVPSIGRAELADPPIPAEAAATHELYERHAARLHAYCLHRLGSREEAEDAVQTIFMNAFRALRRGVVPEAELAWLYKIAENVCLSRHRSTRRRGRVEAPNDFELLGEIVPAPARGAREELFGLEQALAALPEQQRRAILLREWQGLSYREIADELELSQSAVETLIFRARRSLARELAEPERRVGLRRARKAFDLGTLAAALKGLFEGAAAVKATATAVAVTAAAGAAVTAGPPVLDRVREPKPAPPKTQRADAVVPERPAAARVVVVPDATARPIVARATPRPAAKRPLRAPASAPPVRRGADAAPVVAGPAPVAPVPEPVPPPAPAVEGAAPSTPPAAEPISREEQRDERRERPESASAPGGDDRRGGEAVAKRDEKRELRVDARQPEPAERGRSTDEGDRRETKSEGKHEQKQEQKDERKDEQPKSSERGEDSGKHDDERLAVSEPAAITPVVTVAAPVSAPVEPEAADGDEPAAEATVGPPPAIAGGDHEGAGEKDEKGEKGEKDGKDGKAAKDEQPGHEEPGKADPGRGR